MEEPLTYRVEIPEVRLTAQQRREVAERLERVIACAYADQAYIPPSLIEELCNIIRFIADPPPAPLSIEITPEPETGMADPRL